MSSAVEPSLLEEIQSLVRASRLAAARQVSSLVVWMKFEGGRRIVVHEQRGEARAAYGGAVLGSLSTSLTAEFGRSPA